MESHGRDDDSVQEKKELKLCGICGTNFAKNINYVYMGMCNLVTIKKVSCWARRMTYLCLDQR